MNKKQNFFYNFSKFRIKFVEFNFWLIIESGEFFSEFSGGFKFFEKGKIKSKAEGIFLFF